LGTALAATAALAAAPAASPPHLDAALAKAAPGLVRYLKDHDYKVVGVLPFLAHVGKGRLRDDFGPLHRTLARRLEVALVLAMNDDSLLLVTDAGDSVINSGNMRASHRTPSGRRELFRIKEKCFHPAWGDKQARPDVYLTGEAELSPDFRTITVTVRAFDAKNSQKDPVPVGNPIVASAEPRTLTEAGVSYASRGAPDPDEKDNAVAQGPSPYLPPALTAKDGKPEEDSEKSFADLDKESPVRLEVRYNNKVQPVRRGIVPTPEEGDSVTFRLKNEGSETYGVVLKVNGQNVLFREEKDPYNCLKLILQPNQEVTVRGFQRTDAKAEDFDVKPPEESRSLAAQYGPRAGFIDMVVFRAATAKDEATIKAAAKRQNDYVAIARGVVLPKGTHPPADLLALQGQLQAKAGQTSRGMIVPGAEVDSEVKEVVFEPFPKPVVSLTIRYYEPK
jgi:hypothetical protein